MLKRLMATSDDVSFTILRLVLGVVFFAHGAQKMLGWFGGYGFHATMGFFAHMGMPAPVAFLVICTEFFGGLGLIVGLLTRIAALGIGGEMIGAIFMVHLQNGFFMNWMGNQKGEGFEYHLRRLPWLRHCCCEGRARSRWIGRFRSELTCPTEVKGPRRESRVAVTSDNCRASPGWTGQSPVPTRSNSSASYPSSA